MENEMLNRNLDFHNKIAGDYDRLMNENPFSVYLRNEFHKIIDKYIKHGCKVLDLGCGTGDDAIYAARQNAKVTAIDISEEMINIAEAKTQNAGLKSKIKYYAADIEQWVNENNEPFDVVISNFNAINYVKDLDKFLQHLNKSINKNGTAVITMINNKSISEFYFYFLKFKFNKSLNSLFNRKKNIITELNIYPVNRVNKLFRKYFKMKKAEGISIIAPPYSMQGIYKKLKKIMPVILKLEKLISSNSFFYNYSDHIIWELKKK